MKKSSSLHSYKLDFNLKQCKIGQSSIDRLPLKPDARRYSASHLPRPLLTQQKGELEQLKNQNAILKRQNQILRRQLDGYKRPSVGSSKFNTEAKVLEYRDKIRSKMNSKVKSSRETECDEALMTTKEVSLEQINVTISDWYDQYNLSKKLPSIFDLQNIADRFFKDYCTNYAKLKSLFECLQCPKQQEQYKKLSDLIQLYKMPLLYQKSPQTLFRELSKSKDKTRIKTVEKQQLIWQTLSPKDTLTRFEDLLNKLCQSGQMLKALRGNEKVIRFIRKIVEKN